MRRTAFALVWVVALLLLAPAAARGLTLQQAVDALFKEGYPQRLEQTITGFRSAPLGSRWTGSAADERAARFIADEMKAAGLTDVALEPVPVDAWSSGEASVTVGARVLPASSYPGVPATGAAGVTGQVVRIPGAASAADFAKAGDLTGKIALIAFAPEYWWSDLPCAEAALRGARAVIMVHDPAYPGSQGAPGAFASNDPRSIPGSPPLVWLPSTSAAWLERLVARGATRATVRLTSSHTLAADGGAGYNVVGSLPGDDGTSIVLGAHHDAFFGGALDDTASCVAQLVMAKAMRMAGVETSSTVVFFDTTAEEWGYTDCHYDWMAGSAYAIQHTHADWPGTVRAMLGLDTPGCRGGRVWFTASRDLKPWLEAEMSAHPELVGAQGVVFTPDQSPWFSLNDQWPFTAAGIPSACMWTADDRYFANVYHTDLDTPGLVDWDLLKQNVELQLELVRSLDQGVLPYHLSDEAASLAAASRAAGFGAAGVDATVTAGYLSATRSYARAAKAFDDARARVDASAEATVNAGLLGIERELGTHLTGLDVWDDTIYPFQQSMVDLAGMQAAVAALSAKPVRYQAALTALQGVGLTWCGTHFSYPVYAQELRARRPGSGRSGIAGLAHLAMEVDVVPEYDSVVRARAARTVPTETIVGLRAKIAAEQTDIADRLQLLSGMLGDAVGRLQAITPGGGDQSARAQGRVGPRGHRPGPPG